MTDLRQRAILEAVAAGTLSPEDAATRLSDLSPPDDEDERADQRARPDSSASAPPPTAASDGPVSEVRVSVALRSVEIVGDPSVREAVADGPHVAHREGSILVIESRVDDEMRSSGFKFRPAGGRIRIGNFGSFGGFGSSFGSFEDALPMSALTVRMNPDLALDCKVEAGTLRAKGVHGPIRARVAAGAAKIDGFESPIDIDVSAGSFKGRGRLDAGSSRIHCDAGSVRLHLVDGSSVRVQGEATLGKVSVLGGGDSATVGGGSGSLDIEVNLGSVAVTSGDELSPARHAPRDCPVCGDRLAVTRLGCTGCGTELSGTFASCDFCSLGADDRSLLQVFLASRGNMKELERHLGVSYPTARARFDSLLAKLGMDRSAAAEEPVSVLDELARGDIDVDEALRRLG